MECLYAPDLDEGSREILLQEEEYRHLRALRLREGERVFLTNGAGLCAEGITSFIKKDSAKIGIKRLFPSFGELPFRLSVGLGVMENRERFELCVEKCTELGMTDFTPILTQFSQKRTVNAERLRQKSLSAVKQCRRSILPTIAEAVSLSAFLENIPPTTTVILADEHGENPAFFAASDVLVLVGGEGGFSPDELAKIRCRENILRWNLGSRRLRAETAAVLMCGFAEKMNTIAR